MLSSAEPTCISIIQLNINLGPVPPWFILSNPINAHIAHVRRVALHFCHPILVMLYAGPGEHVTTEE